MDQSVGVESESVAGYFVLPVSPAPFMLLDSLEAIDAERITTPLDNLTEHTGYLFVALLPEGVESLSDKYTT